jgi:hypothetical protein
MPTLSRWLASLFIIGLLVATVVSYHQIYQPPVPMPALVRGPVTPVAWVQADAKYLSIAMEWYYKKHGRFPTLAEFWQVVGHAPVKNGFSGSDTVVAMSRDMDASAVGWVYDEASGAVYPGGIFGATTSPTSRPMF